MTSSWEDILYDEEEVEKENLSRLFISISLILMFGTSDDAINFFKTSRRSLTNKNLLERIKENEYKHKLDPSVYQTVYNSGYIDRGPFSRLGLNWRDFRNPSLLSNYYSPSLIGPTLPELKDAVVMWMEEREKATQLFGSIESWDVSKVENMKGLFKNMDTFNEDIGNWKVGNVRNMESMFEGCTNFNQDIGKWKVGNVRNMKSMFQGCTNFDQNIRKWDVSNVIDCGNSAMAFSKAVFTGCNLNNKRQPIFVKKSKSSYK